MPIKAFNSVVGLIGGKRPINADRLLSDARKRTGRSSFGDDFAGDAFSRLVESINREARLHEFGSLMIREKIRTQLENRLWAEHWFEKHPGINEQEVKPILVISGLQRTGTTKMQRLLSRQPGARPLRSWEALYPAPLGNEGESDKRKSLTRRNEKAVRFISPVFHAIHPIHTDQPEEDVLLLDLNFMSTSAEAIMHVPSFAEWLGEQSQEEAYDFEARMLKLLQWQNSADYWVLKSPHHLEFIDAMTAALPVKGVIWMHRNLEKCVHSFMSMLYYGRAMFSDDVRDNEILEHWIPKTGKMLESGLEFRKNNPDLVHDIHFDQLMGSPDIELRKLAKKFPGTISENPVIPEESYVSRHSYSQADWQIDQSLWDAAFENYLKEYHE